MTWLTNPYRFGGLTRAFASDTDIANVASGSAALVLPPGDAGQLLVAQIGFRGAALFSPAAGWTIAFQAGGDTSVLGQVGTMVAYKTRGASEPNPTFTRTGGARARGCVVGYTPSIGALSFGSVTQNNNAGASSTTASVGSLTSVGSKSLIVAFIVKPFAWTTIAAGLSAASLPAAPTSGTLVPAPTGLVSDTEWGNSWFASNGLAPVVGMQGFDLVREGAGASGAISVSGVPNTPYYAVAVDFSWLA